MSDGNQKPQPYIIQYGTKQIVVDNPNNFSQTSQQFKIYYQQNPNKLVLPESQDYSFKTLQLLVNACQGRPFSCTLDNVFEFRRLAIDWKVETLVQYCDNYIQKTKISELTVDEIFERLDEAVASNDKDARKIAIRNAVAMFKPVITDPQQRLRNYDTDIITEIYRDVNPSGRNADLFANFVIEFFRANPAKATTLFPRLNFDRLSGSQYGVIFQPDAIEVSMNYYNAYAISDSHKELRTALNTVDATAKQAVKQNRQKYEKKFATIFEQTKANRRSDLNKLRLRLVQQNEDLNDLAEVLENQKALLVDCVKLAHRAPSSTEYLKKSQEDILNMIKEKKEKLLNQIKEDEEDSAKAFQELLDESQKEIEAQTAGKSLVAPEIISGMEEHKQRFAEINHGLADCARQLREIQACTMAKIIRDYYKGNEYLRIVRDNNNNPLAYKIFDEYPDLVWNLSKKEVADLEKKVIIPIETEVERTCAIKK